jgi:hypothetical protein
MNLSTTINLLTPATPFNPRSKGSPSPFRAQSPVQAQAIQNRVQFASTFAEREKALEKTLDEIPDARYQLIDSQAETIYAHGTHHASVKLTRRAIVWDSDKNGFIYRHEQFHQYFHDGVHKRRVEVSAEVPLGGNTMTKILDEKGIFVDGDNHRLILPDGNWIHGPSGKLHTLQGVDYSQYQAQNSKEV